MGKFSAGDTLLFSPISRVYTVRCCTKRFLVCTTDGEQRNSDENYTIVDLVNNIRGPEKFIYPNRTLDNEDCNDTLFRVASGSTGICLVNRVELTIFEHTKAAKAL